MVPTLKRRESEGENNKLKDKTIGRLERRKNNNIFATEKETFQQVSFVKPKGNKVKIHVVKYTKLRYDKRECSYIKRKYTECCFKST